MSARPRAAILPISLPPRGLNRVEAAAYIGIGGTKFDEMVIDGRMPGPKRVDTKPIWDRHALDLAFEALPDEGEWNPWNGASPNAGQVTGRKRNG